MPTEQTKVVPRWTALEANLKARYDACNDASATPSSILLAVLNAVADVNRDATPAPVQGSGGEGVRLECDEAQRARFEAIYAAEGVSIPNMPARFDRLPNGLYADREVRRAWHWFNRAQASDPWYVTTPPSPGSESADPMHKAASDTAPDEGHVKGTGEQAVPSWADALAEKWACCLAADHFCGPAFKQCAQELLDAAYGRAGPPYRFVYGVGRKVAGEQAGEVAAVLKELAAYSDNECARAAEALIRQQASALEQARAECEHARRDGEQAARKVYSGWLAQARADCERLRSDRREWIALSESLTDQRNRERYAAEAQVERLHQSLATLQAEHQQLVQHASKQRERIEGLREVLRDAREEVQNTRTEIFDSEAVDAAGVGPIVTDPDAAEELARLDALLARIDTLLASGGEGGT